jgi:hypothetical protein
MKMLLIPLQIVSRLASGNILVSLLPLLCILCFNCWSTKIWAAETALQSPPAQSIKTPSDVPLSEGMTQLPPVNVVASPESMTGQGNTLGGDILKQLPQRTNSINEAISILPGVQLSDDAFLSTQGGEILPPAVSISGGKIYDNNFTIDGISNNSLLDPTSDNPVELFDVQGHPQGLFIDPALIEQVTVFDSNVPASHGGFKGGVVEATTLTPASFFSGRIFYQTTRDQWTSFHLDPGEKEDFEQSQNHTQQPEFEKHHAGLELHTPLSPNMRLLTSYVQQYSQIPLSHFNEKKNQYRRQENLFVKYLYTPSTASSLNLSWVYSPYEARYFFKNYRNSDYTLHGGGTQVAADYQTIINGHGLKMLMGYAVSENSRKAPKDAKKWKITPSKGWGESVGTSTSNEGFFGDLEKTQETFQVKTDLSMAPVSINSTSHQLNAGIDYQHIKGTFDRQETSYYYYSSNLDSAVNCDGNTMDCVQGEQYFKTRNVYPENKVTASINQIAAYLEDIIKFKRLELRPGARLSYDDFMYNLNLAPRLAAAFDLFGNRKSVLIAGRNRYYANTLLTYKLREARTPLYGYRETRTVDGDHQLNDWQLAAATYSASKYSALETPYSDEYMLGFEQALLGGRLNFKYVERKNRKEFARDLSDDTVDGLRFYTLNNNGRSRHQSYQLAWERQWRNHSILINGTYEETTTSNNSYDVTLEEEDLQEQVWYDGHAIDITELPRTDYNRPWTVNLVYTGRLPYGFSLSGLAKYRSGYKALKDTNDDIELPDGRELPIYDEVNRGGALLLSCRIDWEKLLYQTHILALNIEINNLLNKKVNAGNSDDYEIGRQVWAGMEYKF